MKTSPNGPLRVGIGGPVGTGKTALTDALCKSMRDNYQIAVVTNDIYTKEDAQFLTRSGALDPDRIVGVKTGGCPHTAIREDASMNLAAIDDLNKRFADLDLVIVESGGDFLPRTHGSDDLYHRRPGRRQNPAKGRPRHHAFRSSGHQQGRLSAPGRCIAGSHGP